MAAEGHAAAGVTLAGAVGAARAGWRGVFAFGLGDSGGCVMALRWYVIEAHVSRDAAASLELGRAGIRNWRPLIEKRCSARPAPGARKAKAAGQSPERRRVLIPRFPPYVFIETGTIETLIGPIENEASVRRVIRYSGGEEPAVVPRAAIEWLMAMKAVDRAQGVEIYPKSVIEFRDGPFVGIMGRVTRFDIRGFGMAEIELFGRSTPIPFEVDHVTVRELGPRPPNLATLKRKAA